MYLILGTILAVFCLYLAIYYNSLKNAMLTKLKSRHVLITGGSKGIGKEMAKIALKYGAHVTIVARNSDELDKVKLELIKQSNPEVQNVQAFSCDVTGSPSNIEQVITEAEQASGSVFLLICCAGTAIARTFDDTPLDEFHRMMDINYFGTVNTIKAALPSLKKNYARSHILMFSSLAGLFGLYGYSAYSASKFALVGLAESLAQELRPFNIKLTVSFPPDTDTPGFSNEQIGKPEITKQISEDGGLHSAAEVAQKALCDTLCSEFISTVGLNGFVLTSLCAGMMPTRSKLMRISQVITMGLFRLLGLHLLYTWDRKILKAHGDTKDSKKSE